MGLALFVVSNISGLEHEAVALAVLAVVLDSTPDSASCRDLYPGLSLWLPNLCSCEHRREFAGLRGGGALGARWVRALLGLCAVLFCVALAGLTVDIVMRTR